MLVKPLAGQGADRLRGNHSRILVTGGSGWLGRATLHLLHDLLGDRFHERVRCFGARPRPIELLDGITIDQLPLAALAEIALAPSILFHIAFPTKDRAEVMSEDSYVDSCRALRASVFGCLDRIGVTSLFLPSSGAVYAAEDSTKAAAMRLYGRLKLEDEAAARAWAAAGPGRRAAIVRIFNLSGPYINKHGTYALAAFIADALAGRPIRIGASRRVLRSYVPIRELISVVLGVLTAADDGTKVFDTAGDLAYEMAEIAEIAKHELGSASAIERPPLGDQEADIYVGDGTLYSELRRGFGVEAVDFAAQVRETAAFMARSH